MSDIALRVENLSKLYHIGRARRRHDTLRDALVDFLPRISRINTKKDRKIRENSPNSWQKDSDDDTLWALKDVSFEVKRGEVVGVIGRNGAGKSTLLKILSRITEPTSGRVEIHGRVGSLLEVGTGFHPELTGRENIYLNGAILGMKRTEIDRKFDEIVAFSEIEKFLDTPVKRYSSGMYVRLAFAVAAHLEPEILLVDEVLAVGDAAFQKKCLGKMGDIAGEGRTVIFVSHSMPTIENLCKHVFWMNTGNIVLSGDARPVVAQYINTINQLTSDEARKIGEYQNLGHRRGTGEIQFQSFRLLDSQGNEKQVFCIDEPITMKVDYCVYRNVDDVMFSFGIVDYAQRVFLTHWLGHQFPHKFQAGDKGTLVVHIPAGFLRGRKYYFYLRIVGPNIDMPFDIWDGVGTEFTMVYPDNVDGLEFSVGRDPGLVTLPISVIVQKE